MKLTLVESVNPVATGRVHDDGSVAFTPLKSEPEALQGAAGELEHLEGEGPRASSAPVGAAVLRKRRNAQTRRTNVAGRSNDTTG